MLTPTQLTGGGFQDSEGNVLANGYLTMRLSQDGTVTGVGSICAGIELNIQLDADGNVVASPAQSAWANSNISPVNTFYRVTGYTAQGQPAWGPNNQQVGAGATFDVGTWIPNQVISWQPSVQVPELEVNGTPNQDQSLLNLTAGTNITIVDEGAGEVLISASGGGSFDTAGEGYFFGGQSYSNVSDNSGGSIQLDGTVGVVQLILDSKWVISAASAFCITGNGSGAKATAAIYSLDGNTKLLDCGSNAFDMSTASQTTSRVTFSPVTLNPGVYWFAWSSNSASGGSMLLHDDVSSLSALLNNWSYPYSASVPPIRFGTAANPTSGGAMPSTLGTITPYAYGSETNVLAVMFQV
jgi:hypothetical protein